MVLDLLSTTNKHKEKKVMFYYKPGINLSLINCPIFANGDYAEEKENVLSMDFTLSREDKLMHRLE